MIEPLLPATEHWTYYWAADRVNDHTATDVIPMTSSRASGTWTYNVGAWP